jgi:hypothetical protein
MCQKRILQAQFGHTPIKLPSLVREPNVRVSPANSEVRQHYLAFVKIVEIIGKKPLDTNPDRAFVSMKAGRGRGIPLAVRGSMPPQAKNRGQSYLGE